MSEDREKLKQLLLSEEIAEIKVLRQMLEDHNQFSKKVSDVLDQATDMAINNNPNFQKKFSKIDSKAYVRAIKANKQTFIDALLPIIGPMIRQSVTNAIRRFVADVNRAMELGFSAKALKWRWQAITTGVPFAELVFNNTIEYQVQQIFLIDNDTGLLIEYAGQENELLQDKDAMSAMLTAIQDFVKDSIDNESRGLSAAELGDKLLWLIQGKNANMAILVKGAPSNRLRETLTDACETIHIDFRDDLQNQDTWNNNPELKLQLEQLLLTKNQSDKQEASKSIKIWPWFVIIFSLLGWYSWNKYNNYKTYQNNQQLLKQTPGFVLQNLTSKDGAFHATGLKDPAADLSHLPNNIHVEYTPFISLEDSMTVARVQNFLQNQALNVQIDNGIVTLTGTLDKSAELINRIGNLPLLAGVSQVIDKSTQQETVREILARFISANPPPPNTELTASQDTITVSGEAMASVVNPYLKLLSDRFSSVDTSLLQIHKTAELKEKILQSRLSMVNPDELNSNQKSYLSSIVNNFSLLLTENPALKLKVIPRSDCQGTTEKSNTNINRRASLVMQTLLDSAIEPDYIFTELNYCKQSNEEVILELLSVWFEVVE